MLKVIGKRKNFQGCSRKPNTFLIWATRKETFALFLDTPDGRLFYFQCAPLPGGALCIMFKNHVRS